MSILLGILGTICLGYYMACVRYAGTRVSLLWVWLVGGIGFWGGFLGIRFNLFGYLIRQVPWWIRLSVATAAILAAVVLAILTGLVLLAMGSGGKQDLDILVVLGCQVKGRVPSRALLGRLETAKRYLEKNPGTLAVLSGGQGYGEAVTEAECMRQWLEERWIAPDRLILEERSTSTAENLLFSMRILKKQGLEQTLKVGVVTNGFHMYRSLGIARKTGFEDVCGISAPGGGVLTPHYVLREAVAILKEMVCGNV